MAHQFLLIPRRELLVHEETRPSRVERLAASIAGLGYVLSPVIAEEKSLTIIDGHHRFTALGLLRARFVPVVLARYGDGIEAVKPPRRIIRVRASDAEEALNRAAEAVESLTTRGSGRVVLRIGPRSLVLSGNLDSVHRVLGELEQRIIGARGALFHVEAVPEPIKPEMILSSAARGEPYKPKTSIHITRLKRLKLPVRLRDLL